MKKEHLQENRNAVVQSSKSNLSMSYFNFIVSSNSEDI